MLEEPKRDLQLGDILRLDDFSEEFVAVVSFTKGGNGRTDNGYIVNKNGHRRNGVWYYRVLRNGFLEYKLIGHAGCEIQSTEEA